jgi:uncharacterized protein
MAEEKKSKRGFASMDAEKVKKIASKAGRRSHELGRGHQFTSEEARVAGSKGGKARGKNAKLKPKLLFSLQPDPDPGRVAKIEKQKNKKIKESNSTF